MLLLLFFGWRTKLNLLGGQNSKRLLRRSRSICLHHRFSRHLREVFLLVFLTQETVGKEYVITYVGRRLIDAETRYTFIENLCLSLYYACTKQRHYLLSSTCIVTCQADVIKHMLQKPILSGRIGKWAYALVEYNLAYESLRAVRGQIVADFVGVYRQACSGIPLAVRFVGRDRLLWNSMVQGTQRFR